jgi:hypothetical protein
MKMMPASNEKRIIPAGLIAVLQNFVLHILLSI